jgi:predicted TIM-barrel fold metal-dependent hydrolase
LIGVPAIPVYNIDVGIKELERCRKAGLKGCIIWQAPHPDLPFHSNHYDKFWAAAQDLGAPVSLHILTGHSYNKDKNRKGVERYRGSVNLKLFDIANALFELVFYGVLERNPQLKIVSVENEAGWLPWIVQQWDYYYRRFRGVNPPPFNKDPREYIHDQVYCCFFNDSVAGHNLEWWGQDNVMWSNDFPHPNSTWPNSLKIIKRDIGHLPVETQTKVLAGNVSRLYNLDLAKIPTGIAKAAAAAQASA